MKDTVYFIVISLIMVVMAYFVAFGCEKLIEKKTHVKFSSEKTKVNKLVIMAMLSAVAVVLMYFDFPLVFLAPGFYKLDFSEVPVLIGSFLLGPCAGVIIEAVKVLLHMCLKGTTTAFVGDFANFILGCAYVVPAAVIYHLHKTKKMAVVSLIAGGVILIISGTLLNAFICCRNIRSYTVCRFRRLLKWAVRLTVQSTIFFRLLHWQLHRLI